MKLRVYDTQAREKRDFEPLVPKQVRVYVCGMTVQDRPHVGHLRSAIAHDTIRRYLTHLGYDVRFVYNFTDVDDKIIERADGEGVEFRTVAERNIDAYLRFSDAMHVRRATVYPRATEHIAEIQEMIARLIERGYAYPAAGDVYYDVRKKADYGKLSGRNVDELRAGARIEVGEEKRDPLDFALWKGAKPGEPSWPSPWGPGRPGWHIECSAMVRKHLGETIDLHGGGMDLIFPHHENEIAQSEAATGQPFVRFWVHNGLVNLGGQKMSKSERRFFLIEDVLERFRPSEVRFYLLSTHYRSPIEFNEERLEEARGAYHRLVETLARCGAFSRRDGGGARLVPTDPAIEAAVAAFHEAMHDDFNSAKALGHLFDLSRAANRLLESGDSAQAAEAAMRLRELGELLGLFLDGEPAEESWPQEILDLVAERESARQGKNWGRADELRSALLERGVLVEDGAAGPKLKRK